VPRRDDEPAGIGSVIRELLGETSMRQGLALGRLTRSWAEVVGPELAAETRPIALDEAALVVGASSPAWAAHVRFLADEIRRKTSETLGGRPVGPVRVVVREGPQNRR
jgi:predicted nucleic acid-binding Zn ribbon protein